MNGLSIEDLILINQWAQGVKDDKVIIKFAEKRSEIDLPGLLIWLGELARQASANDEDAIKAVQQVPFKATRSASVILSKGISMETYRKMESLKGGDGRDAAILFLYLFRNADKRRCFNRPRCSHWWHQDLSDDRILDKIRNEYSAGMLK